MEHEQVIGKIVDVKVETHDAFITLITDESVQIGNNVTFTMEVDSINKSRQSLEIVAIEIEGDKLQFEPKDTSPTIVAFSAT